MKTKRVVKAQVQPVVRCNHHELAERIADDLFWIHTGRFAKRLVLEIEDGRNGGGWCHSAVVDRVETILKSAI